MPLTTVVSYPERGNGGNNRYRGNCSPKLIEDLIGFYKPHEICDYMVGSGTTDAAAQTCGIQSKTYDLHSGFDILNSDIAERPEFIFWHPPYWDMITYSDNMYKAQDVEAKYGYNPNNSDLSRIKDWDAFVGAMNYAMMKQFNALQKGGRIAVLMGDIKRKGKLYSMLSQIAKPGTLEQVIIKMQHNCTSNAVTYGGRFIPIVHEYVMIVRKDNPILIPILTSHKIEVDIRDNPDATWRDVVAATLETANGEVTLDYLYGQIDGHRKTETNNHWKEKIRQTLQTNPAHFEHTGKGTWKLRAAA